MRFAKYYERTESISDMKHGDIVSAGYLETAANPGEEKVPNGTQFAKNYLAEAEKEESKPGRARWLWWLVLVLGLIIVGVVTIVMCKMLIWNKHSKGDNSTSNNSTTPASAAVTRVCNFTMNPRVCELTLTQTPGANQANDEALVGMIITIAQGMVTKARGLFEFIKENEGNSTLKNIADSCSQALDDADADLSETENGWQKLLKGQGGLDTFNTIRSAVSAAMTYNSECIDDLQPLANSSSRLMTAYSQVVTGDLSLANAVSLIGSLPSISPAVSDLVERSKKVILKNGTTEFNMSQITLFNENDLPKEEDAQYPNISDAAYAPTPESRRRRGLLFMNVPETPEDEDIPDWARRGLGELVGARATITVDKAGTGQFTTLKDALASINAKNKNRVVIFIKAGYYVEQNLIPKGKDFITLIGEGANRTFLIERKSVVEHGITTMLTATLGVASKQFRMMGITVINTAGVQNHQAVAFRAASDFAVIYQCTFLGYQDTLYVHNRRQYYREVIVEGTVDFIFGNAAAIIHKSLINVRWNGQSQEVATITAQGRKVRGDATGIILLASRIRLKQDLLYQQSLNANNFRIYFGRPWKMFSMTAIINCIIGQGIHPDGWASWNGLVYDTVEYYEYGNLGPGAVTAKRVPWSKQISAEQASRYSLQSFLSASLWVPVTGVPYN